MASLALSLAYSLFTSTVISLALLVSSSDSLSVYSTVVLLDLLALSSAYLLVSSTVISLVSSFAVGFFVGLFDGYLVGFFVCRRFLCRFTRQLFLWIIRSPSASLSVYLTVISLASSVALSLAYSLVSLTVILLASLALLLVSSGRHCIEYSFKGFNWSHLIIC